MIDRQLPENWAWMTVADVQAPHARAIVSGPFGSNIGKRFFVSDGIPVIRGNNLTTHIPHPDWALLGIISVTGKSGQHPGLQQSTAYTPCSPSPWYLGNDFVDSRRLGRKSTLRVAVARSQNPLDWNGLRGRNVLGSSGFEKFQKVCTGRCEI